jgi:hypothetical protein
MLLESRLDEKTALFIDCETVGGFGKGEAGSGFDPDAVLDNVVTLATGLGKALAAAAAGAGKSQPAPASLELEFALRIDSNSVVAVAANPESGQFRVRVRWGR